MVKTLYLRLSQSGLMTTTAPRPTVVGAMRQRVIQFAERVTTPLVPADYLDVIDPLRSGAELRGRIVAIQPETRDAATLVIKPGRGWRGHTPGQYIRIGVDVDGIRQWRAYSLTSNTADATIAITVKAIPDGTVSNHLVRRATVGTVVHLDHASGEFTLGARTPEKILFLTAGSGITPVMGMLRNMETTKDVVVVHSAPTPEDVIFSRELRAMARAGRITLVEKHTDSDGMLDVARIDDVVADFADRQTWACGPAGMLDALEGHWDSMGIADRLHTERFRPSIIAEAGDGGTVTFTGSETTVDAGGAETLLDAGEAAGVLMPSGCRMGICFGCVAPLRRGAVRDLRTGDVTTATEGDNVHIQTCVSAAAGSCDIEL
ncbi:MAG: stearoyl-CoA 9-desaturase oxidoreductase [Mycobacterium sp.]|nr:stearoyl-CoA 9-desaturase oxidoreductase [Mycobacterium sp.]